MTIKKLFAGILAAVISVATVTMPLSTAIAEEGDPPATPSTTEGKITIKNPLSGGTYTAYPIFTGNVEISTDAETKDRLVIDNIDWHENLAWTQYTSGGTLYTTGASVIEGYGQIGNASRKHVNGLYDYVKSGFANSSFRRIEIDGEDLTLAELMAKYGYYNKSGSSNLTSLNTPGEGDPSSKYAEEVAKLLNLTNTYSNDALATVTNSSSFYAAFAEAAIAFMKFTPEGPVKTPQHNGSAITTDTDEDGNTIWLYDDVYEPELDENGDPKKDENDNIVYTTTPVEFHLTSYKFVNGSVTVPQGYYVVEWTPDDDYTETDPRTIRRSLVLVPPASVQSEVTISSKDTVNIASLDVEFYDKAGTPTTTTTGSGNDEVTTVTGATFPAGGTWNNAVSMESSSYVNCRVVVTLPSNLCDYSQYYLAVPIMYDYNRSLKGLSRIKDEDIKVYLINANGSTTDIDVDSAMTIEKDTTSSILKLVTETANPTASDGSTLNSRDKYVPEEAFVINDILALTEIKTAAAGYTPLKLAFEFPVEFKRASLFAGNLSIGQDRKTYGGTSESIIDGAGWANPDDFLKNYITAKAVYSNNPNLEPLKDTDFTTETDEDGSTILTQTTVGINIWSDTTEAPGSVYNPVSITTPGYANIVTYRMRIHVTTEDILEYKNSNTTNNGIGGVQFALTKTIGGTVYYATVEKYGTGNASLYDKTDDKDWSTNGTADAYAYQITGWKTKDEVTDENGDLVGVVMTTCKSTTPTPAENGRIEILGVGAETYTLVCLTTSLKVSSGYSGDPDVDYKIPEKFEVAIKSELNQDAARAYYMYESTAVSGIIEKLDADTDPDILYGTREDTALVSLRIKCTKKGLSLPVTGGIGTFIFFAVGGALVITSTVFIVTRIRMKKEKF